MNGRGYMVRKGIKVLVLLLILLATAVGAQPPIHQVGERWSAWDAPAQAPEGYRVYVIQSGDTLWSVAERLLGDPYLWPQLWEQNKYIQDAEWIYPGDPLIVPQTTFTPADGVAGQPITTDPVTGQPSATDPYQAADAPLREDPSRNFSLQLEEVTEAPVPLGFESDIYCTGYVGEVDEEFAYSIAASEYTFLNPTLDPGGDRGQLGGLKGAQAEKDYLTVGEVIYIQGGRADGISPGMVLTSIRPHDQPMRHPLTNKVIGRVYSYTGQVRVLSAQEDIAIGEIILGCDPILVGQALRPFEPQPVPLRRITPMRPVNLPHSEDVIEAGPTIIAAYDDILVIAAGNLVYIDRGYEEDVAAGDIFTIYRTTPEGLPAVVLGELGIITSYKSSSLARVYRSRYSIYTGDKLVLK